MPHELQYKVSNTRMDAHDMETAMARMDISIYASAPDNRYDDVDGRRPHRSITVARRWGDDRSARHAAIAVRGAEASRRDAIADARYAC